MARQVVQTGDFPCGPAGSASGKIKVSVALPLTLDCPIEQRQHEIFDLNDAEATLGDMDPIAFAGLLKEGQVINGYKTYIKNDEGIEQTVTLLVKKGGDNAFIRRIEALADDIGRTGGDILTSMLLIIESIVDGVSPTITKTRVYFAQADSGSTPNTGISAEAAEYSFELKLPGRPMVLKSSETAMVLDTKLTLNPTHTLTYDESTKTVSGTVTLPEVAGKEAEFTVSLLDTEEREGIFLTGSHHEYKTDTGEITVNMTAPVTIDTKELDFSVNVAGITILNGKIAIPNPVSADIVVSDIAAKTAKTTITVSDTQNVLKTNKLDYEVVDVAKKKVVAQGKVTSGTQISLTSLAAGTKYTVKVSKDGLEIDEKSFTTLAS